MPDYEARLFRANDTLAVVAPIVASNDYDAKVSAVRYLTGEIAYIRLSRDGEEFATVRPRRE